MKPKIQDVAKVAGVSPTTVSRVLNNRGYISQETKDKVFDAMKQTNYIPNDLARSLYNKRTNLIGLIIPSASNPFYGELATYIENICADKGLKVLFCNSMNHADKEQEYWEMLQRNQVDGVIVITYNRGLVDKKSMFPAVAIDHYLSDNMSVVGSDNYKGGKLATQKLLQDGCRNIIHINGPSALETPANLRRVAYEDTMRKNNLKPFSYEISETAFPGEQINIIKSIFSEHPEVDGIFASDDIIAIKIIQEANKMGYSVPEDIKIVGYDGTELIRSLYPELTTIVQPIPSIAETAVELLQQQMDDKDAVKREIVLPVKISEGKSG